MNLDLRSKHLRRLIVRGLAGGNQGHIGASMSLVEILRVLYDDVLRYDPGNPKWPDRDRLILSKGHGCLALYAILADKGFFPVEELDRFCRKGGILGGHPDHTVPGVEAATGSLGHGLSIGVGMALAARIQGRPSRVFVVMGDGEIQEGSVWEAAMSAARHGLSNLTVVVDYNKLQSAMPTAPLLEPVIAWPTLADRLTLADKWRAFGFVVKAPEGHPHGHDVDELKRAFFTGILSDRPAVVIAHTVKGAGIPFAENDPLWHHRPKFEPETIAAMREALT